MDTQRCNEMCEAIDKLRGLLKISILGGDQQSSIIMVDQLVDMVKSNLVEAVTTIENAGSMIELQRAFIEKMTKDL